MKLLDTLPADLFLRPFCYVLEATLGRNDYFEDLIGDYSKLSLNLLSQSLARPAASKVKETARPFELDKVRKLGEGIGDDVGSVPF